MSDYSGFLKNLRLGTSISDNAELLKAIWRDSTEFCGLIDYCFLKYELKGEFLLKFNLNSGRLAQISYLKGSTFRLPTGIKVGDAISDVAEKYSLKYDDDENYFFDERYKELAFFLENPYQTLEENPHNKVEEITISDYEELYY